MKLGTWLNLAVNKLVIAGIGTARLDALVLLEDVTGRDRAWLLAHPETEILSSQMTQLEKLLSKRAQHIPLAYVRKRTEFYGRNFVISPAVLEPRPESETMVDLFKSLPILQETGRNQRQTGPVVPGKVKRKQPAIRVADVGTGSGALGITSKLEAPDIEVDLVEVDPKAAKVARRNVDLFTLDISVIESDLLAGTKDSYDVLLCNLPYVPDDYQINRAALHEPRLAIFGGPDGLDVYRRLFKQVAELNNQPLYILTEALPMQHADLATIAGQSGYKVEKVQDFIQLYCYKG